MTDPRDRINRLEERAKLLLARREHLRGQLRCWSRLAIVTALALGAGSAAAPQDAGQSALGTYLRAPLRILDRSGRPFLEASADQRVPRVALLARDGSLRAVMLATSEGGSVVLYDQGAISVAGAGASPAGGLLRLGNSAGFDTVRMSSVSTGEPSVWLFNADGQEMVGLRCAAAAGVIGLAGSEGGSAIEAAAGPEGGYLRIHNPKGPPAVSLSTSQRGGNLSLHDAGGKTVWDQP